MRATSIFAVILAAVFAVGIAQAVTPGRNGLIYFENFDETSLSSDIFSVSANGSAVRNLTRESKASEIQATVSPNRQSVAFLSNRADGEHYRLFVMTAAGENARPLGGGASEHSSPVWSPNSAQIAFGRCTALDEDTADCTRAHIAVINANGSNLRFLSPPSGAFMDDRPTWSPDGKLIVFQRMNGEGQFSLWTMTPTGTKLRRIVAYGSTVEMAPTWAPNGKRIAYASDTGGREGLYSVTPTGTKRVKISEEQRAGDVGEGMSNPVYSPDGSRIAFTADGDLWTIGTGGRNRVQVTKDGGDESDWARG